MAPTTVGPRWTRVCWNITLPAPPTSTLNGTDVDEVDEELDTRDRHALLYIVVVLLFYSTGIVVAIVMYLKREKAEIEEEKAYDDYASFRSDPDRWARYFRVQRMIAQLDRVEREAAEKRRQQAEIAEASALKTQEPSASRWSPRRITSSSSGLKIHVTDTGGGDPTPLLGVRGSPKFPRIPTVMHAGGQTLGRTRSYAGTTGTPTSVELKRCPKSSTTLQVSNV